MTALRKIPLADAYALIALVFGLVFIVVTPPFGVGDETTHYERAYEVATGRFLGGEGLPAGMQTFIDDAFGMVKAGDAVDAGDYARWAAIDLDTDEITPYPDPLRAIMRLQYPGNYALLAPATAVGVGVGAPPLAILYLLRAISLAAGVMLVRYAIALAPAPFRAPVAFLGLMPTTMVFFSGVNVESTLIGLAFLYFALIANLASRADERLTRKELVSLVALAFVLGQFKSGYLLLPALALILPATKFASPGARLVTLALIMAPGALVSMAWVATAKTAMLGDIAYSTLPGNRVAPDEQIAYILADPVRYAGILLHTYFGTSEGVEQAMFMIGLGGWSNIRLAGPAYAVLSCAALFVWMSGEKPPAAMRTPFSMLTQAAIFIGTTVGVMTAMYIGWTAVGGTTVEGFQGRYWIAVAPLLLALAPFRISLLADPRRRNAVALGASAFGLVAMTAALVAAYW